MTKEQEEFARKLGAQMGQKGFGPDSNPYAKIDKQVAGAWESGRCSAEGARRVIDQRQAEIREDRRCLKPLPLRLRASP